MDNQSMDEINEARRQAIARTIRPITPEELKALGEGLFPMADHPWRTAYFTFLSENAGAPFFHATTEDRIHFIFCSTKEKGMWFTPGSGMGPLREKGVGILKEVVAGMH